MRPAARAAFRPLSERLEGKTRHPYADVRGLVTVSVGCLIDPFHLALTLPWMIGDRPATTTEVQADWQAIKQLGNTWDKPWTAKRQEALTQIRLTDDGVERLMGDRLEANRAYLQAKLFPEWPEYSADAHLAIMLTAWAIGAAFDKASPPRPALVAAIRERRWADAKVHARLREQGNPGVIDRNRAIERCFDNAATVADHALDPSVLHWPATVIPPVDISVHDTDPSELAPESRS